MPQSPRVKPRVPGATHRPHLRDSQLYALSPSQSPEGSSLYTKPTFFSGLRGRAQIGKIRVLNPSLPTERPRGAKEPASAGPQGLSVGSQGLGIHFMTWAPILH